MSNREKNNMEYNENISLKVIRFGKKYSGNKNHAVKNASFLVKKGEFHGFIGANGAGKTTTIKSIIGAYAKFEGEILILGNKHNTIQAKKELGYIPEKTNFPKNLSTYAYIKHMCHLTGMSLKKSAIYSKNALEEVGLKNVMRRSPLTFSSGQKKKVLLAQALVNKPKVIIMDEPAANLDPKARHDFFNTLKKLKETGVAIFISSHILTELDQYVDSVTIIDGGEIVFTGSKENLISSNQNKYLIIPEDKNDIKIILLTLDKLKIKGSNKEGQINFSLAKKEDQFKVLNALAEKKIKIKRFSTNEKTLQEAYNYYVQKGSVDTYDNLTNSREGGA